MTAYPVLPPAIGDRQLSMPMTWCGVGTIRVYLLPTRDLAVSIPRLVELVDIETPPAELFGECPVTWSRSSSDPDTDYLWARDVAKAAAQHGDPSLAVEFSRWIDAMQRDMCERDWEGTLDSILENPIASPDGVEYSAQAAANRIMEQYGGHVTRDHILDRMQSLDWIKRPSHGRGWRPTLLARAERVVFGRMRHLDGGAGAYEQCYLTGRGFDRLAADVRPTLEAPLFEGAGG